MSSRRFWLQQVPIAASYHMYVHAARQRPKPKPQVNHHHRILIRNNEVGAF